MGRGEREVGRGEKRVREESKPGRKKEGTGGGGEGGGGKGQEEEGANAHIKASESQWPTQRRDSISYKKFLQGKKPKKHEHEIIGSFHEMSTTINEV